MGRYPALAGVDLDVDQGEVLLVTGPNGAGKTTLLRLLAGLAPLTSGEGTVLGHDLAEDRRPLRAKVALLGHETFCYDDLTARENLRFHARAAGCPTERVDDALRAVGLDRVATTPHRALSAGQRRRVALSLVLVRDAALLLLDEPHAGLDAGGRAVLDGVVRDASREGTTVVLASHEVERARPLCTREVEMAGGVTRGGLTIEEAPGPPAPAPALVS